MSDVPDAFDEVQIFIDPGGTVTICDLWEGLLPVAEALGDVAPACPLAPIAVADRCEGARGPSSAGAGSTASAPGSAADPTHTPPGWDPAKGPDDDIEPRLESGAPPARPGTSPRRSRIQTSGPGRLSMWPRGDLVTHNKTSGPGRLSMWPRGDLVTHNKTSGPGRLSMWPRGDLVTHNKTS